ncbi:MAG: DUF4760 domain-containing protein [Longibaculum sp.]
MDIITIIQLISAVFIPLQLFFVYKQVKIAQNQMNENRELSKTDATLKIIGEYSNLISELDNNLIEKMKLLSLKSNDFSTNEINALLSDISNRKQLFILCDYFERLSLGIISECLDEEMVYAQMAPTLITNFDNLNAYIFIRRNEAKSNICGNFEYLANKWKKRQLNQ